MNIKKLPRLYFAFFVFSVSIISARYAYAQDGSLDMTFNGTGRLVWNLGQQEWIRAVLVQPDGNIIAAGGAWSGPKTRFVLARFYSDGGSDPTFGPGGIVYTAIGTGKDEIAALALQPDGKILAAGGTESSFYTKFALARYLPDGELDSTFSSDGLAIAAAGAGSSQSTSMVLQPDGKIVLGGLRDNGSKYEFTLMRFNTDGSLDTSFSSDGIVKTSIGAGDALIYALALQADGKIIAVGTGSKTGFSGEFVVARYHTDGQLDSTFNGDGIVSEGYLGGGYAISPTSVEIQPDGKIVVAGNGYGSTSSTYSYFILMRFFPDGTLDPAFDSDGKIAIDVSPGPDRARDLALQADGKMIVAGDSRTATQEDFSVVRLLNDGSLDTGFDSDGIAITGLSTDEDFANAVAIQSDGKVLLAGAYYDGSWDFGMVRYLNTVLPASISYATACDVYDWNGTLYTGSGTYYDTIPAAGGGDSLMTLVLTIHPSPTVDFIPAEDTVCSNALPFALSGGLPSGGTYAGAGVSGGTFSPSVAGPGLFTITYHFTDAYGCSGADSASILVEVCAGIHDPASRIPVQILPNPSGGVFSISSPLEIRELKVFNSAGQSVLQQRFSQPSFRADIDISDRSKGVYLVKVTTLEGTAAMKVVLQ